MTARIPDALRTCIEARILPRYDGFKAAHRRDQAETVIHQSPETAAARVRRSLTIPAATHPRHPLQKSLLPQNSQFSND